MSTKTSSGANPEYRNTTVVIVEDEAVTAADLERSLADLGYAVAGIADSVSTALELVEQVGPDLIIMDIRLRGPEDGISAAEHVRFRWHIPVVFVTAFAEADTLQRAVAAGAEGFVIKPFRVADLDAAIQVALHQHHRTPELLRNRVDEKDPRVELLTARETEVLRLIGEGKRTKDIASELGISFKTAVTHRSNIMEKLGIREGPNLVRFAIRTGIADL